MKHKKNAFQHKLTIIGGGIVGWLQAYAAYKEHEKKGHRIRITIHEKNKNITETTTSNILPSLTIDEILSVVPRGRTLIEKLLYKFNQPGGIRVDDVPDVDQNSSGDEFKHAVEIDGQNDEAFEQRTQTLLEMGRLSMDLWQAMYDDGDEEFKQIMRESNFNPCREPRQKIKKELHDGYRIDLIYGIEGAEKKAAGMKADYEKLGYENCAVLLPDEVVTIDPFLADFCEAHSEVSADGKRRWKSDATALWRPGGCIDTNAFLPKLYNYLRKKMGEDFHLHFDHQVDKVGLNHEKNKINSLHFFGHHKGMRRERHPYKKHDYVFAPGEAVGTMRKLGFEDPAYAGFAGASLRLNIPLTAKQQKQFAEFNHCMEVHREGVVLAWQARLRDSKLFIGVAGTKAFYADQMPDKNQEFAKDRNLLQLNMINHVLPEMISIALGRNTKAETLTAADLEQLESKGIATRWVGRRAAAFDGSPTIGKVHYHGKPIEDTLEIKDLSSGGVSFGPAAVFIGNQIRKSHGKKDDLVKRVEHFADPRRRCR